MENVAPSGAMAPNVSPPHIINVSIRHQSWIIWNLVKLEKSENTGSTFDSNKKNAFFSHQT